MRAYVAAASGLAFYCYLAATREVDVAYDAVAVAVAYSLFRLHSFFGSGAEGPPRWDSLPIAPAGRRSVKGSAAPEPNTRLESEGEPAYGFQR